MHITICFHFFFVFFSNSIEIRDHVKPFRPGTSFRSIHEVKHFSIFVQMLSMPSFESFVIWLDVIDWENIKIIVFIPISKEEIDPGPARDQNRHPKLKYLSIFRLVFNYGVYKAIFCHFIVLQHVRGRKISKRENNINQFITISENYWTRD